MALGWHGKLGAADYLDTGRYLECASGAQQIGARLSVWSRPGAGTEVDLSIPANLAYLRVQKTNRESWIHSVIKRRKSR